MSMNEMFNRFEIGMLSFIAGALFVLMIVGSSTSTPERLVVYDVDTVMVQSPVDTFSEEALLDYLVSLNVKHPHIVLAQARLETGNFSSSIFKENNNLFGMREAKLRLTTNIGTSRSHAKYLDWKSSVLDYALWQSSYLPHAKSETVYYDYLSKRYAQDPYYVGKVKQISQKVKDEYDI